MTLKTLFAIPIAIILLVTLSLAGMVATQGWSGQVQGRAAVEAVERMRLLQELQSELRAERLVSNFALGSPWPTPGAVRQRLVDARRDTDRGIAAIDNRLMANIVYDSNGDPPPAYLPTVRTRLTAARAWIDALLVGSPAGRSFVSLNETMPRMLAVSQVLDEPLNRASLAVTAADPALSGLVIEDRLTASLRDHVGLIAAVLMPRFNANERPDAAELGRVRLFLARAAYVTVLLSGATEVTGGSDAIRVALAELQTIDVVGILRRLDDLTDAAADIQDTIEPLLPQAVLVPWGERINVLRTAIVNATVERVTERRDARERQFDIVLTAFGLVMMAVLESAVLLSQRVVGPIAQLGLAITRIAAGDRGVPLVMRSGTREISEMVTAVETLRRAALVADAATMRQRQAARHRMMALRQAIGIVQTVREPARALERGVASLSEGIDAAIALTTTPTSSPPDTLERAATAVRVGLAEMRQSAADLEATFAAAGEAQTEELPEAEFVAHILSVQAQVDQSDATVRGFVQSSLVGLRDAASADGGLTLRDLVSDQFQRIEATVATVASMRDATARAATIVRDLPFEEAPLAA
jgi:hypothetical protein